MVTCPKCKSEAKPDAQFCSNCGSKLSQRLCANGHVMEPDWETCRYCPPATSPAATRVIKPTRVVSPLKPVSVDPVTIRDRQPGTTQLYDETKTGGGPQLAGWLVVTEGKDKWKDYRVTGDQIVLGRDKDCDIIIDDKRASARHASVRPRDEKIFVTDLDSSNGTFVNGAQISRVELEDGAEIKIGDTTLRFRRF